MAGVFAQIFVDTDAGGPDLLFLVQIVGAAPGIGAAGHIVGDDLHQVCFLTQGRKVCVHFLSADDVGRVDRDLLSGPHEVADGFPHPGLLIGGMDGVVKEGDPVGLHGEGFIIPGLIGGRIRGLQGVSVGGEPLDAFLGFFPVAHFRIQLRVGQLPDRLEILL